jgi:hypothetical protein
LLIARKTLLWNVENTIFINQSVLTILYQRRDQHDHRSRVRMAFFLGNFE